MAPALPAEKYLALTVTNVVVYSVLFIFVYTQMWMILAYRHKRLSYQTIFLFLCLIWAALRIVLFSFYFSDSVVVDALPIIWYWLLYSFPVCLQYITLVLLVVFFAQVVFKAKSRDNPNRYRKCQVALFAIATFSTLSFITVNAVCTALARAYRQPCGACDAALQRLRMLAQARVALNDSCSLLTGCVLAWLLYRLSKIASARGGVALKVKGNTVCQTYLACAFIILLYMSKAAYNVAAVTNNDDTMRWIRVTDQADFVSLYEGNNYLYYGIVLLVWEVLPTFIVTAYFRVQKPVAVSPNLADLSHGSTGAYFFDDPRLYDSYGDVTRNLGRPNVHIQSRLSTQSHLTASASSSMLVRPQLTYGTVAGGHTAVAASVGARSAASSVMASVPARMHPAHFPGRSAAAGSVPSQHIQWPPRPGAN